MRWETVAGAMAIVGVLGCTGTSAGPPTDHATDERASPCSRATDTATLVPPGEPGTPLEVEGQVFLPDGVMPAPGVILYVYQTDNRGLYNEPGRHEPRLRAWLRTDAQGRYRYRTIRPAPYPNGRIAAHVHTQLWGDGAATQWNEDLLFEDDDNVSPRDRERSRAAGRFAFVVAPTLRDGVLRARHDLRLKTSPDPFREARHGLDACGM